VAVLAGPWLVDEMTARLSTALNLRRQPKWLLRWVNRIITFFGQAPPAPTQFRVARFIASDRVFDKVLDILYTRTARVSLNFQDLPRPQMAPAPGVRLNAEIPALSTAGELARWLKISPAELDWFADCHGHERKHAEGPLRHYRYRWIPKSSGRMRLVEIPKVRLKNLQRRVLHEILAQVIPHAACHAFRDGHSTVNCAAAHIGQRVVLRIDLREFFPSIRSSRVQALFHTLGYPDEVARLLTGLCTNTTPTEVFADRPVLESPAADQRAFAMPHLPQGAPTSPALANLCGFRLDCRLAGLARRHRINYTRYADDLVFSGNRDFERNLARFRVFACAIVLNEGFAIRRRKTRVMRSGCRQEVTGIVVNRRLNVPRDEFDRLKAILHNCVMRGPQDQNRTGHENFREHLRGRIAYVRMVHQARGERLMSLFDRIDWGSE
jgi:RNA-directed DNA polymerase